MPSKAMRRLVMGIGLAVLGGGMKTQNGQEIRIKGRGLPRRGSSQKGDLVVLARVVLPTLGEDERERLEPILAANPQPNPREKQSQVR